MCFRCHSRGNCRLRHSNPCKKPQERRHHLECQLKLLRFWRLEPVRVPRPERVVLEMIPIILMVGLGRPFWRGDRWYTGFIRTLCCCFWRDVECNGSPNCIFPPAFMDMNGSNKKQVFFLCVSGNLWNESNWLVRQCKKLDHNRDLEIVKPVQHVEVEWEVIIMWNSFYHLNISKDIWGCL